MRVRVRVRVRVRETVALLFVIYYLLRPYKDKTREVSQRTISAR